MLINYFVAVIMKPRQMTESLRFHLILTRVHSGLNGGLLYAKEVLTQLVTDSIKWVKVFWTYIIVDFLQIENYVLYQTIRPIFLP